MRFIGLVVVAGCVSMSAHPSVVTVCYNKVLYCFSLYYSHDQQDSILQHNWGKSHNLVMSRNFLVYICRMSFHIYLSSISTISSCACIYIVYVMMRQRSGKESYGDIRAESSKATEKTFYAECKASLALPTLLTQWCREQPKRATLVDQGHTHLLKYCMQESMHIVVVAT